MKWTPEKIKQIKALFLKGLSTPEIARRMKLTYAQVLGFITRHGWTREAIKSNKDVFREKVVAPILDEKKDILATKKIKNLLRKQKYRLSDFYGNTLRFGIVSETHFGSLYEKYQELVNAYKYFKKEGIKIVFHCGDVVEGERVYPGQEYERYISGGDNLVKKVIEEYPKVKGIKTYYILGSHDLSYWKIAGIDVGEKISEKRKDLIYVGREEADIKVGPNIIIRMVHPGGGSSYAISYKIQKYIESLSGGQKPTICLFGHYHKAFYMPCYRNVFAIATGCLQGQTGFMRRHNLAAHLGFWVCEAIINKQKLVSKLKAEFIGFYEKPQIYEI